MHTYIYIYIIYTHKFTVHSPIKHMHATHIRDCDVNTCTHRFRFLIIARAAVCKVACGEIMCDLHDRLFHCISAYSWPAQRKR